MAAVEAGLALRQQAAALEAKRAEQRAAAKRMAAKRLSKPGPETTTGDELADLVRRTYFQQMQGPEKIGKRKREPAVELPDDPWAEHVKRQLFGEWETK